MIPLPLPQPQKRRSTSSSNVLKALVVLMFLLMLLIVMQIVLNYSIALIYDKVGNSPVVQEVITCARWGIFILVGVAVIWLIVELINMVRARTET